MDVALDSALEAFPEEELVRRDQIVSLMTNFKTALARAKEAEIRVRKPSAEAVSHMREGLITGSLEGPACQCYICGWNDHEPGARAKLSCS